MLVILDTTALVQDPLFTGTTWRVLVPAAARWGVQLMVPEVVIAEAVGGYVHRAEEARVGLERWAEKHRAVLGEAPPAAAREVLSEMAAGYEERLLAALDEMGAVVVAAPSIDHMTIVRRATLRRRPCDSDGDGYRDTLNWLTVLELLAKNKSETCVWVSANTKDFGSADDASVLHSQLVEDLAEIDATERLLWFQELSGAVLHLAELNLSATSGERLADIRGKIQDSAIADFIEANLIPTAIGMHVSKRYCGLPIDTQAAEIASARSISDLVITVRGEVGDRESVVEISLKMETELTVRLVKPPANDPSITIISSDADGSTALITKYLRYTGIVEVGQFGQPLEGEWTRIRALVGDPGVEAWRNDSNGFAGMFSSPIPQSVLEGLVTPLIPSGLIESIGKLAFPPGILDAIKGSIIPPGILDALRGPIVPSYVFEAMKKPIIPPGLLDAFKGSAIPPGFLDALKNPVLPPGILEFRASKISSDAPTSNGADPAATEEEESSRDSDGGPREGDGAAEDGPSV